MLEEVSPPLPDEVGEPVPVGPTETVATNHEHVAKGSKG